LHVKAGGAVPGRRVFTALESFFFMYKKLRALWSLWKLLVALLVFFFRDAFRERGFLAGSDEEEEDRLIHRLLRNAQTVKIFTK
jgi:hypothetical protein